MNMPRMRPSGMRRETAWLCALVVAFVAVNLATGTRYPAVWVDEVQFADPAINLVSGHGFTSSVWVKQDAAAFWAGNVPLYTGLLAAWLKVTGVSVLAVRSLNFVLMPLVAIVVWAFARRSGLVPDARARLLLVGLLLTGHALTFSFRMGRYDVLGMLLFALAAFAWTVPAPRRRRVALFGLAALAPACGLQLVPAAVLYCALLLLFRRRACVRDVAAVGAGLVAGAAGLYAFYATHGVWEAFRASTTAVGVIGHGLADKLRDLPRIYLADKSQLALACAALVLLVTTRRPPWRCDPLRFGLAAAVVIPAVLQLAAKFPVYYGWLVYAPLAVGVTGALGATSNGVRPSRRVTGLVAICLAAAVAVGLPARLVGSAWNWNRSDPAALEREVVTSIGADDVVLTDFKAYYAVKQHATALFAPTYLGPMGDAEKRSLTAVLVRADRAPAILSGVSGDWRAVGAPLAAGSGAAGWPERLMREFAEENFPLQLYRRMDDPRAAAVGERRHS
jgi:hypothetical protein